MNVILMSLPMFYTKYPPLSLALMAGELRDHEIKVECFDFNIDSFKKADKAGATHLNNAPLQ